MCHVARGSGAFDTGATGSAASKPQFDQLSKDGPDSFGPLDTARRKLVGFSGGAKTFSLGVRPQTITTGPLANSSFAWSASDSPGAQDLTPQLIPIPRSRSPFGQKWDLVRWFHRSQFVLVATLTSEAASHHAPFTLVL